MEELDFSGDILIRIVEKSLDHLHRGEIMMLHLGCLTRKIIGLEEGLVICKVLYKPEQGCKHVLGDLVNYTPKSNVASEADYITLGPWEVEGISDYVTVYMAYPDQVHSIHVLERGL